MADPALSFPTQWNVPTGGGVGSLPPQSTLSSTLNAPISPAMLKPSAPPPAAPAAAPPVAAPAPAPQPSAMLPPATQRPGGFMLPDKGIENRLEANQGKIISGTQDLGRLQANVATTTAQAGADVARQKDESDRALFNKQLGIIQQEAQADAPFVPTKENAGTMGLVFAMIGMIGSSLGGKNTTMSALGAQEAMTGMLKGWQEGDAEKYQEAKDAYNDNVAHLQRSVAMAKEAFDIYQKEAVSDIAAAKAKWDVKIAEANAPVLAKTAELKGFDQVGHMIEDQQKFNDKFIEANNKIVEESQRHADAQGGGATVLGPDSIQYLVDLAKTGNMQEVNSLLGSSFGNAGKMNRQAFLQAAINSGLPPEVMSQAQSMFAGTLSGERALGTQSGRVAGAIGALQTTVPLARAASAQVDRGQFPNINSVTNAISKGTGGTAIIQFNAYNQAVVNDYAQIMRRGGASTDEASKRANEILSTAFSQGQYEVGLQTLDAEATAVKDGLKNAKDVIAGKTTKTTSPEDRQALDWANSHPNDPRAKQIKAKLGM